MARPAPRQRRVPSRPAFSLLEVTIVLTVIARRVTAAVVIDSATGVVEVRTGGGRVSRRQLRAVYGIVLGSNRDSAVYDARGLGFGVTNLTVTVRRGAFVDTLTMSRLGRTKW